MISELDRSRIELTTEIGAEESLGIEPIRILMLDRHELRLVLSGLKRLRHQIKGDIARQKRDGWKPAAGHMDNNVLRLQGVDRLLKRYDLHKEA